MAMRRFAYELLDVFTDVPFGRNPIGILEDPATGSAVGPLAAYLWRHGLIATGEHWFRQGHHLGRRGCLRVTLEGGAELEVAGASVVMGAGALQHP